MHQLKRDPPLPPACCPALYLTPPGCLLPHCPLPAARPVRSAQATGGAVEKERSTREAVLADAQALLAVRGGACGWRGAVGIGGDVGGGRCPDAGLQADK